MKRNRYRGRGDYAYRNKLPGFLIPALFAALPAAALSVLYYFFGMGTEAISGFGCAVLLGCLICFLAGKNFDSLILFAVFSLLWEGIGYFLLFFLFFRWLPADPGLYWAPALGTFLTAAFGTAVRIFTKSRQLKNFNRFFILFNTALGTVYLGFLAYGLFISNADYSPATGKMQWIPFARLAEYIEDFIRGEGSAGAIVTYLLPRLLMYVPYGFYISVLLRENAVLLRLPLLFILPAAAEWAQWQFALGAADIDEVIFGIIGGIAGVLFYCLIDFISRKCSGRKLLERESAYGNFGGYRL